MRFSTWTLTGQRAECRHSDTPCWIDLDRPGDGIVFEPRHGSAGARLLGVDLRSECRRTERWVRGRDVTAIYEPADSRHLRATAMWRLPAAGDAAVPPGITAWEVVVSAQTALLQSDSILAVVSDVAATEVFAPAANCRLARGDNGTTAVVIVHPDDLRRLTVERHDGRATISCWLFSSAVEKGVLLRSRVLAAIGPSVNDTAWAATLADAFATSPPILTT